MCLEAALGCLARSPKPYEFIGFGDIRGPKAYEFIGFDDIHGPTPYEFIGFGASSQKTGFIGL
jgi:hypothetical protein